MSTTHELRWGRLTVVTDRLTAERRREDVDPHVTLTAYTRTEQARVIPLTERELTELIADASAALVRIQTLQRGRAAAAAQAERRRTGEHQHVQTPCPRTGCALSAGHMGQHEGAR